MFGFGGMPDFASLSGLLGDAGAGGAGGGLGQMHERFQQELLSNPDMLRQVLDSPLVQNIMSNPDIIRSMLSANPQIQQLMEVFNLNDSLNVITS